MRAACRFISEDCRLYIFNTLSLGGAGCLFLVLGLVEIGDPIYTVLLFTSISLCTGASASGFVKGGYLYGRQYAGFVIGVCQFLKSITLFLVPALAGILVTRADSSFQWRVIYVGTSVALFVSAALFIKYATAEPPEYTKEAVVEPGRELKVEIEPATKRRIVVDSN